MLVQSARWDIPVRRSRRDLLNRYSRWGTYICAGGAQCGPCRFRREELDRAQDSAHVGYVYHAEGGKFCFDVHETHRVDQTYQMGNQNIPNGLSKRDMWDQNSNKDIISSNLSWRRG